jgi:hypothetical protein
MISDQSFFFGSRQRLKFFFWFLFPECRFSYSFMYIEILFSSFSVLSAVKAHA